ncbi:MAG TPA: transcription antitermination factor NusB [Candidatus Dormibacteraeota bacterium]|nr:transcription antitermination factor NusB [Candidatus Dormibacteraeota bacterium]
MTPSGVGRRHRGRELALRVLFELEGTRKDAREVLRYHADDTGATPDVERFATQLVLGVLQELQRVDDAVESASSNWRLEEIGKVERAVLRVGTYELLFDVETPVSVAIDEAVELAKTYAGDEAGSFVNGVLGRIAAERV